jgi:hypothetical protein
MAQIIASQPRHGATHPVAGLPPNVVGGRSAAPVGGRGPAAPAEVAAAPPPAPGARASPPRPMLGDKAAGDIIEVPGRDGSAEPLVLPHAPAPLLTPCEQVPPAAALAAPRARAPVSSSSSIHDNVGLHARVHKHTRPPRGGHNLHPYVERVQLSVRSLNRSDHLHYYNITTTNITTTPNNTTPPTTPRTVALHTKPQIARRIFSSCNLCEQANVLDAARHSLQVSRPRGIILVAHIPFGCLRVHPFRHPRATQRTF